MRRQVWAFLASIGAGHSERCLGNLRHSDLGCCVGGARCLWLGGPPGSGTTSILSRCHISCGPSCFYHEARNRPKTSRDSQNPDVAINLLTLRWEGGERL